MYLSVCLSVCLILEGQNIWMEKARANICYKQITNMYEVTVVTEEYEYVTS